MIGIRAILQLILVITSVAIISAFIRPTFNELRAIQDETKLYSEALENLSKFNQEISRLNSIVNSFSTTELQALNRFLPLNVDGIAVMRDIETIVGLSGMTLDVVAASNEEAVKQIDYVPSQGQEVTEADAEVIAHQFTVIVSGSYEQFKELLMALEKNAYPLELVQLSFAYGEGDLIKFSFTLETYSRPVNGIDTR